MVNRLIELEATARLLDGRLVSLRRLAADDADAVVRLNQQLSEYDCCLRFSALHPADLDELVSKLTEPAHGRCALGAFDADQLIGVANYTVICDDPRIAEIAIVVAHEHHSVGVGAALLEHLAQIARAHGIGRFVADVMADNHLMLMVLFDLGWRCEPLEGGAVRHLEIELPNSSASLNSR